MRAVFLQNLCVARRGVSLPNAVVKSYRNKQEASLCCLVVLSSPLSGHQIEDALEPAPNPAFHSIVPMNCTKAFVFGMRTRRASSGCLAQRSGTTHSAQSNRLKQSWLREIDSSIWATTFTRSTLQGQTTNSPQSSTPGSRHNTASQKAVCHTSTRSSSRSTNREQMNERSLPSFPHVRNRVQEAPLSGRLRDLRN